MTFEVVGDGCRLRPPASPAEWTTAFAIQSAALFAGAPPPPPRHDRRGDLYLPLVFELDGRIIGTIVIDRLTRERVAFRRVAIAEGMRGRGYGAQLLSLAEALAAGLGASEAVLHGKVDSIGFYRRIGYVESAWDEPCAYAGSVNLGKALPPTPRPDLDDEDEGAAEHARAWMTA